MEVQQIPSFSEHMLSQIPKMKRRSDNEIFIDILRACISPSYRSWITRKANLNDKTFQDKMPILVANGLVVVNSDGLGLRYVRRLYVTSTRGRQAISYWIALEGIFKAT